MSTENFWREWKTLDNGPGGMVVFGMLVFGQCFALPLTILSRHDLAPPTAVIAVWGAAALGWATICPPLCNTVLNWGVKYSCQMWSVTELFGPTNEEQSWAEGLWRWTDGTWVQWGYIEGPFPAIRMAWKDVHQQAESMIGLWAAKLFPSHYHSYTGLYSSSRHGRYPPPQSTATQNVDKPDNDTAAEDTVHKTRGFVHVLATLLTAGVFASAVHMTVVLIAVFVPVVRVVITVIRAVAAANGRDVPPMQLWDVLATVFVAHFILGFVFEAFLWFVHQGNTPGEEVPEPVLPVLWRYNATVAHRIIALQTVAFWRPPLPWKRTGRIGDTLADLGPVPFNRTAVTIIFVSDVVALTVAHLVRDSACGPTDGSPPHPLLWFSEHALKVIMGRGWPSWDEAAEGWLCAEARWTGLHAACLTSFVALAIELAFPCVVRQLAARNYSRTLRVLLRLNLVDLVGGGGGGGRPTALHLAVLTRQLDVVKQLVAAGADVNLQGGKDTPLGLTTLKGGWFEGADFLLEAGATSLKCENKGYTDIPGHCTATNWLLHEAGALTSPRSRFGENYTWPKPSQHWALTVHGKFPPYAKRWICTLLLCLARARQTRPPDTTTSLWGTPLTFHGGNVAVSLPRLPPELVFDVLERLMARDMRRKVLVTAQ